MRVELMTAIAGGLVGGILGAIPGALALYWRKQDRKASYLYINLSIENTHNQFITALTAVENKEIKPKVIDNALLLVGPEDEDPRETVQNIDYDVRSTNEIAEIRVDGKKYGVNGRCLIPVKFYYSENIAIADENISYRVPISAEEITAGIPYSVRFFVLPLGRLHRSTHDCFVL